MKVTVLEMDIKVYLSENINSNESNEYICELIDSVLAKEEKYLKMHNDIGFKKYCFNNFYPMEKDYIYKEGNIYTFKLRSVDKDLVKYIEDNMKNSYTKSIKVLSITSRVIPKKHIDKVFSITPTVIKFESGYWRSSNSIEDIENRIVKNLKKKYKQYCGVELSDNIEVFNFIKLKNKRPIPTKYKNVCLLGDKFEFKVSNNPIAQELLYLALGTGLGEMNARGFGFTNYLWIPKAD